MKQLIVVLFVLTAVTGCVPETRAPLVRCPDNSASFQRAVPSAQTRFVAMRAEASGAVTYDAERNDRVKGVITWKVAVFNVKKVDMMMLVVDFKNAKGEVFKTDKKPVLVRPGELLEKTGETDVGVENIYELAGVSARLEQNYEK